VAASRTSAYLLAQLDELDRNDPPDVGGEAAAEEDRELLRQLQQAALDGRVGLSKAECGQIEQVLGSNPEACEVLLDDCLARRMVKQVPRFVTRLMRFEPILVSALPQGPSNTYLREAVRCYVYGLNSGAVALARAAVEEALSERVSDVCGPGLKLDSLVDVAGRLGILDGVHRQMAGDVKRAGNSVLHDQPCDADRACDVLTKARAVLEVLFSRP
jgi:hypothetical protein